MLDDVGMSSDRNRNRPCAGDGSYEDSTLYLPLLQDSGMTRADSQFCLLYGLGVHGFSLYICTQTGTASRITARHPVACAWTSTELKSCRPSLERW